MQGDEAHLEPVSRPQAVPEGTLEQGEIHLTTSSQQSLQAELLVRVWKPMRDIIKSVLPLLSVRHTNTHISIRICLSKIVLRHYV